MDVAQTWEQLRALAMSDRNQGPARAYHPRQPNVRGYTACLKRVIATEGDEAARNISWRAKHWPRARHLAPALPAEIETVAA